MQIKNRVKNYVYVAISLTANWVSHSEKKTEFASEGQELFSCEQLERRQKMS